MSRRVRRMCGLISIATCCALAAQAFGQGYVPTTYGAGKNYNLPALHKLRFPVMAALDLENNGGPIPWHFDLDSLPNSLFHGKYVTQYPANSLSTFGFLISDGPAYPTPIPAGGAWLIEYIGTSMGVSCGTSPRNPDTPEPPTWTQAKAAADAWCAGTCGQGFEMTDFDMSQWIYACYKYKVDGIWRGYQFSTWGGSMCEKTLDNGLIQACNPLTGLTEVRTHLSRPSSDCPSCDRDGDGLISLRDLMMARNEAFGPKKAGLGVTFPIIHGSGTTVNNSLNLTQFIRPEGRDVSDFIEITHWDAETPVDCSNPASHLTPLRQLTTSDQFSVAFFGQVRANQYCESVCVTGAIGYTIGHCRINKDGTHSIRISCGYCMKCL